MRRLLGLLVMTACSVPGTAAVPRVATAIANVVTHEVEAPSAGKPVTYVAPVPFTKIDAFDPDGRVFGHVRGDVCDVWDAKTGRAKGTIEASTCIGWRARVGYAKGGAHASLQQGNVVVEKDGHATTFEGCHASCSAFAIDGDRVAGLVVYGSEYGTLGTLLVWNTSDPTHPTKVSIPEFWDKPATGSIAFTTRDGNDRVIVLFQGLLNDSPDGTEKSRNFRMSAVDLVTKKTEDIDSGNGRVTLDPFGSVAFVHRAAMFGEESEGTEAFDQVTLLRSAKTSVISQSVASFAQWSADGRACLMQAPIDEFGKLGLVLVSKETRPVPVVEMVWQGMDATIAPRGDRAALLQFESVAITRADGTRISASAPRGSGGKIAFDASGDHVGVLRDGRLVVIDPERRLDLLTWSAISSFAFDPSRADVLAATTRKGETIVRKVTGSEIGRASASIVTGSFANDGARIALASPRELLVFDSNLEARAKIALPNVKSVAHGKDSIAAYDGNTISIFTLDGTRRGSFDDKSVERFLFVVDELHVVHKDGTVSRHDRSGAKIGDGIKLEVAGALSPDGAFACERGTIVRRSDDARLFVMRGTYISASGAFEGAGDHAFVRSGDVLDGHLLELGDRRELHADLRKAFFANEQLPEILMEELTTSRALSAR